jgi:large subunit ribosomal protein L18
MRLVINKKNSRKLKARSTKKVRIRKKIKGTLERPRLCIFKSLSNMYAQLVDDVSGKTILSVSTLSEVKGKSGKDAAFEVGKMLAAKAKDKKIEKIVFDRSGYIYHGRVKAVADGAREGGLNF